MALLFKGSVYFAVCEIVNVSVSDCTHLVVMEHCGQYTILGNIGEGAHGIVFKAKHIEVCFVVNGLDFFSIYKNNCSAQFMVACDFEIFRKLNLSYS